MKTIKNYELKMKRVRLAEPHPAYGRQVHAPTDVASIAKTLIGDGAQEHFCVFLLDIKNRVIGYQEVARGGIDTCPIDPRVVFRAAVATGTASIAVAHNHPSGSANPSSEDIKLTKQLQKAGSVLGIKVLDHVIVTDEETVSLAASGLMPS